MSHPQEKATWMLGTNNNCIVSDIPDGILIPGAIDLQAVDYYGGYLVCESIQKEVAELIIEQHNKAKS